MSVRGTTRLIATQTEMGSECESVRFLCVVDNDVHGGTDRARNERDSQLLKINSRHGSLKGFEGRVIGWDWNCEGVIFSFIFVNRCGVRCWHIWH